VLRRAGRWLGAAIAIAALLGYHRLADFASSRLYYVVLALALAWAVRALLRELANWAGRGLAKQDAAATGNDTSIFRFWTGLAIDALLILAIAPFVLVLAGFSAERLRDLIAQAFLGFRIGGLTISIAQIALAIGFFVAGLAATRLVQRGLARGPFAYSRLDVGVQSSLTTLVGYVGLAVAALIGLTALGVNLSNLAIIAGALSVGLGFGLQSVVNNFVSGLILLFERPIKVGDWVVTASGEGTVRKISVRSTEIETFDRSTIIVPNAELIAQTVTNLTHRDKLGRVTVAVGVAYGSDVEATRAILLKCANEHPDVLQHPEPFVVFKDFGASSLDFELRAFLADIGRGLQARTDLRFAIYKAFGEAGIEIPFPQQVVYIKPVSGAPETGRLRAKPEDGDIAGAAPSREPEEAEELARDD
jgi:small-conductance mechanosensitive channel